MQALDRRRRGKKQRRIPQDPDRRKKEKKRNQFTRKDSEPRIERNGSDFQTKTQVTPKPYHTSSRNQY